ncbi:MAG: N-acetyl-alpha-D-glucosaminyl L-malate synthase BshA [Candidatus Thorarchaeota archaeon]|nr:MAG: N-acetyl-alpha-D-glucosaminyl L-malate synthase BshA [Candidatus Thorarchaeota archaeon]
MKIGVNLYPSVGGSGHLATRLGQELARRNHIIHFITYQRPFSLMWEQTKGVHVDLVDRFEYPLFKATGPPYAMALASKIIKSTKEAKLDLIHSHYAIPHAMAAYMAREIVGVPYVVTLHGSDVHTLGLDPAYKPVVKHTVENANGVTAVSEFLKKKAHEELGIEREIHVIPNFIDIQRFKHLNGIRLFVESGCVGLRTDDNSEELNPEEKILLHASNFRKVKRVVELVEIMRIVVDHFPEVRLIIAGDGPTRIEVERKIEALDLCNNIHLLGIKSNMQEIMCSADMLLLNSTLEGMPLVLLEAMSCSLPVVTTPAGGIPELVRPGKDGAVTKGFEQEEFAHTIIELIENDTKRKSLGKAGRKRVEESFSAKKIVTKYEKVFEEAVS